jgi:two-component system chemotaxis response regulator CheY
MGIKKILVVEDSELLHRMYDLMLANYKKGGAKVYFALNGREALDQLNQNPDTDVILLDINMPVMSGLEFLMHCKKEKVFQDIPVIIVTSEGNAKDTILGLKAGAKGYLTKPFRPDDLFKLIDRIFVAPRK